MKEQNIFMLDPKSDACSPEYVKKLISLSTISSGSINWAVNKMGVNNAFNKQHLADRNKYQYETKNNLRDTLKYWEPFFFFGNDLETISWYAALILSTLQYFIQVIKIFHSWWQTIYSRLRNQLTVSFGRMQFSAGTGRSRKNQCSGQRKTNIGQNPSELFVRP